jgi:hypothetical protein
LNPITGTETEKMVKSYDFDCRIIQLSHEIVIIP